MIVMQGNKSEAQFLDLLTQHMKTIKFYHLLKPVFLWEEGLAGVIHSHKFWVFLFSPYMAVMPYRYFFAEIHVVDNGVKIVGRFRHHPSIFIIYLIAYTIFTLPDIIFGFEQFIWITGIFLVFVICAFVCGILCGKKRENETIKYIEKILMG